MTLDALIMLVGALTVVLPYMGIPSAWDISIYTFFGIIMIILGIAVRRRKGTQQVNTISESKPLHEVHTPAHETQA
jgi:VIT1/CCC1 family predicted Fe2+/Mn2+ transporter